MAGKKRKKRKSANETLKESYNEQDDEALPVKRKQRAVKRKQINYQIDDDDDFDDPYSGEQKRRNTPPTKKEDPPAAASADPDYVEEDEADLLKPVMNENPSQQSAAPSSG